MEPDMTLRCGHGHHSSPSTWASTLQRTYRAVRFKHAQPPSLSPSARGAPCRSVKTPGPASHSGVERMNGCRGAGHDGPSAETRASAIQAQGSPRPLLDVVPWPRMELDSRAAPGARWQISLEDADKGQVIRTRWEQVAVPWTRYADQGRSGNAMRALWACWAPTCCNLSWPACRGCHDCLLPCPPILVSCMAILAPPSVEPGPPQDTGTATVGFCMTRGHGDCGRAPFACIRDVRAS
ncbi:hypothetical protein HIM_04894 [Hirsutella minnesotensis 3608]|uniref:Uncharacterized protein n=1 Tax=Hirsutella minnesotensis 3608 TaxID=1043627 RepID=A0A0F8A0Z8_9HYPO|nr:hypothetical protein HIM_04894 [Hirsutella minnesotensis 3608]